YQTQHHALIFWDRCSSLIRHIRLIFSYFHRLADLQIHNDDRQHHYAGTDCKRKVFIESEEKTSNQESDDSPDTAHEINNPIGLAAERSWREIRHECNCRCSVNAHEKVHRYDCYHHGQKAHPQHWYKDK